ncbi:pyridoxamine 5'-phosphate oxidase family protein [Natronosalvus caseinilyticus]|uniref:pyridoxamine 5'-phosphate oxidase family protein n=1 Tax=Natronosalvus caseinilyticus TaxID=2953747 RepID=UPI0028AE4177|nr:pyridoxamine 5'-phosphate oxidase family protein [Natronosalvus caseinilyticus]
MSEFTKPEIDYLNGQRLGRLATIGPENQPHVVPVGFRYDVETDTIQIGGRNLTETKKFHDVERNPRVAFVAMIWPASIRGWFTVSKYEVGPRHITAMANASAPAPGRHGYRSRPNASSPGASTMTRIDAPVVNRRNQPHGSALECKRSCAST